MAITPSLLACSFVLLAGQLPPDPVPPADNTAPPADHTAPPADNPAPPAHADPAPAPAAPVPATTTAPAPSAPEVAVDTDADRIPIVVLNLKPLGASPALAETVTAHLAAHLDDLGVFQVLTQNDIQNLVDFDATRLTLSDESARSRLTDLGKALGVQYLMFGQLSKTDAGFVVEVVLVDAQATTVLRRESIAPKNSTTLLADSNRAVDTVVRGLLDARRGELFVLSEQEGATLYVDGTAIGALPMAPLSIGAGPHRVEVKKDLYVAETVDVTVQPGRRLTKQVVLVPTAEWVASYNRTAWLWVAAGSLAAAVAVATFAAGAGIWALQRIEVAGYQADPDWPRGNENRDAIILKSEADHTRLTVMRLGGYSLMMLSAIPVAAAAVIFVAADYPGRYDHLLDQSGTAE